MTAASEIVIPESGYPVITALYWSRDAAAYWIIRFRG